MNNEAIRGQFKSNPKLKKFVDWMIMNQVETRPRWFIRMLAPLYQHRGSIQWFIVRPEWIPHPIVSSR